MNADRSQLGLKVMFNLVQYLLLALSEDVHHLHVRRFPVKKVPDPVVNIAVGQDIRLGAKSYENVRNLGSVEEICDGHIGINLSTFDRVESDALVNRVTLVNILGPGTRDHKGWKVIHVLGERVVKDHTRL